MVDQTSYEAKNDDKSEIRKMPNLDFSKIYEPEATKEPQDSSGEEIKNDSRRILQEILATSERKNDSAEESFEKEFQPE